MPSKGGRCPSLSSFPLLLTEPKPPALPSWFIRKGQASLTSVHSGATVPSLFFLLCFSSPWVSVLAVSWLSRPFPATNPVDDTPPERQFWGPRCQAGVVGALPALAPSPPPLPTEGWCLGPLRGYQAWGAADPRLSKGQTQWCFKTASPFRCFPHGVPAASLGDGVRALARGVLWVPNRCSFAPQVF